MDRNTRVSAWLGTLSSVRRTVHRPPHASRARPVPRPRYLHEPEQQACLGPSAVAHHRLGDRIDIPHHKSSRLEVIGSFCFILQIRCRGVVVLAADFHGERRRAIDETHGVSRQGTNVVGSVRAERLTSGKQLRDSIPKAVRPGGANPGRPRVQAQAEVDVSSNPIWQKACRHVLHNPSTNQFGLAFHSIQVIECCLRCWCIHDSPLNRTVISDPRQGSPAVSSRPVSPRPSPNQPGSRAAAPPAQTLTA